MKDQKRQESPWMSFWKKLLENQIDDVKKVVVATWVADQLNVFFYR